MATTTPRRRRRTTPAAKSQRSFSEFESGRQTTPGTICPRCKENEKAGNVGVRLNEKREKGGYGQVTSRHIAFCETCCIEVYEKLVGELETEGNGNGNE